MSLSAIWRDLLHKYPCTSFLAGLGFDLLELEAADFGAVVFDETDLPDTIDKSFAAAVEVVFVEEARGMALNAHNKARAASFLRRW